MRADLKHLERVRKRTDINTSDIQLYKEYFQQNKAMLSSPKKVKNCPGEQFPTGTSQTYSGDGIGFGPMLEENIDDVSVALLSSLVKRGVPILL